MIEVFTQTTCAPCMRLKIFLRGQGVTFLERYIDTDEDAKADFDKLELMSTPAVKCGDQVYIGDNPDTKESVLAYWSQQ